MNEDKLQSILEKLDRIDKKLFYGNGEMPLCEKVNKNERDIRYIKHRPDIIYKIIMVVMVIGQGLLAYKIFFGG